MRKIIFAAAAALANIAAPALAGATPLPAADAAPVHAPKYTTEDTDIGTLLDDPAARAILTKHLPEVIESDQIEMARGMTLRDIQPYAPDDITDEKLAAIDAELAQLAS